MINQQYHMIKRVRIFFSVILTLLFCRSFYSVIKITLISSNDNHLSECKHKITSLAQSVSAELPLTNKEDMLDWSQKTIRKYYDYCLKLRVIPMLDLDNVPAKLIGIKDQVIFQPR